MTFWAFSAVLLATGLMRLVELAVSRARMRARPEAVVEEPGLFPAMAALHAALVTAPIAEVWGLQRPFVPWLAALAASVLALATALRIWTLATLGASWNVRVVRPTRAVTTGPYRWIRHPNYLVVILEIAALPLLHDAWISAIALSACNAAVLWRRILTEERTLADVPGWTEAMRDKARLLPGLL